MVCWFVKLDKDTREEGLVGLWKAVASLDLEGQGSEECGMPWLADFQTLAVSCTEYSEVHHVLL